MKKFLLILLVPLVVSAAAIAAPNPASVTAHCKNLQRQAPSLFGASAQYTNLAACVAAKTVAAAQNTSNAAKACKAEQALGAPAFAAKYAPNANGKNNDAKAMGACVSTTAKATTAAQQTAELNAAKQCKHWRANASDFLTANPTAVGKTFTQFYAKNKNGKNAFGKCVSILAKAQHS